MQSDETLSRDTRMVRVHVTLLDVDGLPMNVTWPEGTIEIVSPSSYFKLQLLRPPLGLSESLVEIPPGIRSDPGSYVVRVWLSNSWDGAKQTRGQCLLFERTVVVVEAGLDYKLVILLALLATVLLVLSAVLTFLIYKNQAKAKQLLLSVVEFEGLLAVEIAAEVCLCRFVLPYSGGWYAFRTFWGLCPLTGLGSRGRRVLHGRNLPQHRQAVRVQAALALRGVLLAGVGVLPPVSSDQVYAFLPEA